MQLTRSPSECFSAWVSRFSRAPSTHRGYTALLLELLPPESPSIEQLDVWYADELDEPEDGEREEDRKDEAFRSQP